MGRRVLLQLPLAAWAGPATILRTGLITDLHWADKTPLGTRYYRESLSRLREAVRQFTAEKAALAVQMGDFIDEAPTPAEEMGFLRTINEAYTAFAGDRHYVLGNHCVWSLTKEEFLDECRLRKSYYSFDRGGFHFVILDACFRHDGVPYGRKNFDWRDTNIPGAELEWLRADLAASRQPVIVFAHQRLDDTEDFSVINRVEVRAALEGAGNVIAVMQGHAHVNAHSRIGGIHYVTLAAAVEGPEPGGGAFGLLDIDPQGVMTLTGYRRQQSRKLKPAG